MGFTASSTALDLSGVYGLPCTTSKRSNAPDRAFFAPTAAFSAGVGGGGGGGVPVWKSTSASGAHFSAMTRPCWLRRVVTNRHRHAIEQVPRRWRGGRRDDSARTRRKILISTQVRASHRTRLGRSARPSERTAASSTALSSSLTYSESTPMLPLAPDATSHVTPSRTWS